MSLINDALKRAHQAQQQAPAPDSPGPQLRPVEPEAHALHNLGLLLPVAFALVALLALALVWELWHVHTHTDQKATTAASPLPVRALSAVQPASAPPVPTAQVPTPATGSALNAASEKSTLSPSSSPPVGTNAISVAEPPAPPRLKLQGIVFNPRRPSAVINGRTTFVGDRIGEFKLVAVTPEGVTLVGGGQTNVLSLSD